MLQEPPQKRKGYKRRFWLLHFMILVCYRDVPVGRLCVFSGLPRTKSLDMGQMNQVDMIEEEKHS